MRVTIFGQSYILERLLTVVTLASALTTIILVFFTLLLQSCEAKQPKWGYESYCLDGDNACIKREVEFYMNNNRGPATDLELTETYQITKEQLFSNKPTFHTARPLPKEFNCKDHRMCDSFMWNPRIHGPATEFSINNL